MPNGAARVGSGSTPRSASWAITAGAQADADLLAGRRILVVEDIHTVARELADRLALFGCRVVGPAARLDDALALLDREAVDAAVLDVNLDGEMAWPVEDALIARGTPFLFLSGYESTAMQRRACSNAPWLIKPVREAELLAALQALFLDEEQR